MPFDCAITTNTNLSPVVLIHYSVVQHSCTLPDVCARATQRLAQNAEIPTISILSPATTKYLFICTKPSRRPTGTCHHASRAETCLPHLHSATLAFLPSPSPPSSSSFPPSSSFSFSPSSISLHRPPLAFHQDLSLSSFKSYFTFAQSSKQPLQWRSWLALPFSWLCSS